MFSDEILEKIFSDPESHKVPVGYQSTMVRVIEKALEESPDYVNKFQSSINDGNGAI